MKLSGLNALVTGGSQGFGRYIVEAFLAEGANVLFCARTAADVARARRLAFLVEDGSVGSLAEAAIRFAIGTPGISTALIGVSSPEQLEQAVKFTNRGPLAADVLARIHAVQRRPE